jgi:hypothetical protein
MKSYDFQQLKTYYASENSLTLRSTSCMIPELIAWSYPVWENRSLRPQKSKISLRSYHVALRILSLFMYKSFSLSEMLPHIIYFSPTKLQNRWTSSLYVGYPQLSRSLIGSIALPPGTSLSLMLLVLWFLFRMLLWFARLISNVKEDMWWR